VQFLKRQWPVVVAFVVGITMWVTFYVPSQGSQDLLDDFNRMARLLFGFAAILGILSLLHHHWSKIKLKKPGFGFSYVTLIAFVVMGAVGLFPIKIPGFAEVYAQSAGGLHMWIYNNMFVPMQATMFSVLAFFIASAAFRAFRARSVEATALLVAGCIMMIGRVPVGDWLADKVDSFTFGPSGEQYSYIDFPAVTSWLLNVPNAAAKRGILLGVLLSQIAIAIRIIFGIERTYMGGGD